MYFARVGTRCARYGERAPRAPPTPRAPRPTRYDRPCALQRFSIMYTYLVNTSIAARKRSAQRDARDKQLRSPMARTAWSCFWGDLFCLQLRIAEVKLRPRGTLAGRSAHFIQRSITMHSLPITRCSLVLRRL